MALPFRLKDEDAEQPPLELVSTSIDAQAMMIELSEMAQRAGAQAVQLLHEFDYGRDLIQSRRRAKIHAGEVHLAAVGLMETVEALSKALRASGAFSTHGGR